MICKKDFHKMYNDIRSEYTMEGEEYVVFAEMHTWILGVCIRNSFD